MRRLVKLIAVVLLLVAGAGVYWFVVRDDAPAKVNVACGPSDSGQGATTGLDGVWKVEPAAAKGQQLRTDAAPGSWAGYRIQEDLRAVYTTAVGRTPDVSGTVTVEANKVTRADVAVDMTTIKSGESFRDNRMKTDGLQTDQFPKATFTLTAPIDLGTGGGCRQAAATGTLNLHGQDKPVTIELKVAPSAGGFDVTGTTRIVLADYGMTPPKLGFVTVDPAGDLELALRLVR